MIPSLRKGALAFIDSLMGAVPCEVLSVFREPLFPWRPNSHLQTRVRVRVTQDHGRFKTYRKGEVMVWNPSMVFPRKARRVNGCGVYHIGAYTCEHDAT